jgi:HNH endonuclease
MICPWCDRALPQGLAGTQVDHIIPVSRGGADDAWNLQLLHGRCNRVKGSKLTPAAAALALAHGIELAHGDSGSVGAQGAESPRKCQIPALL